MKFPTPKDKAAYKRGKKEIRKGRITSILLFALFTALAVYIHPGFFILSFFVIIVYFSLIGKEKKRFKRSFCSKCHAHYDYEEDVSWEVLDVSVSETENTAQEKASVEFTCSCPNCGKERTFTEKFVVASVDKNGNVKENNISTMAKKYFIK